MVQNFLLLYYFSIYTFYAQTAQYYNIIIYDITCLVKNYLNNTCASNAFSEILWISGNLHVIRNPSFTFVSLYKCFNSTETKTFQIVI